MLFTLFFNQPSSRTVFLTDPRSYLLVPTVLAVILILSAICRQVKGSANPSPVHALCRRFSDVSTTYPALGARDNIAVSQS